MTTFPEDVRVAGPAVGEYRGDLRPHLPKAATPGRSDGRPPSDLVQSVSRAFAVLEVVGKAGGPLSAKAIARRTGLNLSTTYHLVHTLCWEGYLVRLASGDYRLGAGIAHRYRDLMSTIGAPAPMREVLRRLAICTGHTGYLGRLVDGRVAVTDVVHAPGTQIIDELAPGFEDRSTGTPLAQVLLGTSAPAGGPGTTGPWLVVEDGRLRSDVSCAAVSVRRMPSGAVAPERWGVGLLGPLGCFAGAAPALRALLHAGEQLAATA